MKIVAFTAAAAVLAVAAVPGWSADDGPTAAGLQIKTDLGKPY